MTAAKLGLLINTAIALGVVALWWRAEKRAGQHARTVGFLKDHPPLPKVEQVQLLDPHRFADPEKEMVRVLGLSDKPTTLGFTDASYQQALMHGGRLEALLSHGQAEVLKK